MNTSTETLVRESEITELSNEELGLRIDCVVRATVQNLADLKPLIEEAWRRLEAGQIVSGCSTKKEFCARILGKTDRAVRYMLSGGNFKRVAEGVKTYEGVPLEDLKRQYKFFNAARSVEEGGGCDAIAHRLNDEINDGVVSVDVAYAEWLEASGTVSAFNDTSDFDAYVNPPVRHEEEPLSSEEITLNDTLPEPEPTSTEESISTQPESESAVPETKNPCAAEYAAARAAAKLPPEQIAAAERKEIG